MDGWALLYVPPRTFSAVEIAAPMGMPGVEEAMNAINHELVLASLGDRGTRCAHSRSQTSAQKLPLFRSGMQCWPLRWRMKRRSVAAYSVVETDGNS